MRTTLIWTLRLALLTLIPACSQSPGHGGPTKAERDLSGPWFPDDADSAPPDLADPNATDDAAAAPASDAGVDTCGERAKLIYAIDVNNTMYSFKPDVLQFTKLGILNCPANGSSPNSMGVDRDTIAWVNYNDGNVFRVDLMNLNCTPTNFVPNQQGFNSFGMGFVADMPGGVAEHLFLANASQLGSMDTKKFTVTVIGQLMTWPELTGTGDAKLWGFFPDAQMPRVAQLDKITAKEGKTFMLPGLAGSPQDWAFAFWGGDFWIFLQKGGEASTSVYHLESANGKVTNVIPNSGKSIVGAGVSICAPTTAIH